MSTPPERQLVTVAAVAAQLGVHPQTVRRWIAQGRLTGYRLGPRLLRLDAAQVDELARELPTVERRG